MRVALDMTGFNKVIDYLRGKMKRSNKIDHEFDLAVKELVGDKRISDKKIRIKQAPFDCGVRVDVVPGKEKIVWLLRNLGDDDYKDVLRAAKQYRRADTILNKIA